MKTTTQKLATRTRRHARIRARVIGTTEKPRLAIFRSNRTVYAQLIDDSKAVTLAAADSRTGKGETPLSRGTEVGAAIAEKAKALGVTAVVFDRGGFKYAGIVAAVADGARAGGLQF